MGIKPYKVRELKEKDFKIITKLKIENKKKLPGFGGSDGASLCNSVCCGDDETKSSLELLKLRRFKRLVLPFLRLIRTGDVFSIATTKFDGKTPVLLPNLPRHHPSST